MISGDVIEPEKTIRGKQPEKQEKKKPLDCTKALKNPDQEG